MRQRRELRFGAFCAIAMTASSAGASSILQLSFADIARQADFVVQAVVEPKSQRVEMRDGAPWTCVTLNVSKVIKGTPGSAPNLCFLGGRVDGGILNVTGIAAPAEGREAIFFCYEASRHYINPLVGWTQGLFYVSRDGGRETISTAAGASIVDVRIGPPIAGAALTPHAAGIIVAQPGVSAATNLTAARFIQFVHQALVAPK